MKDLYNFIVIENNFNHNYFLDEMDISELNMVVEGCIKAEEKELDKLRMLGYWFLAPYSKNIKPEDLLKLPTIDKKPSENEVDKERLKKVAKNMEKKLNEKAWEQVDLNILKKQK